ncbi:hypothetical protein APHAL10511_002746 [Amanita phalloides]|nr:hypothetical protein APHAL10511_002746 [Amanita phalloides]
MDSDDDFDWEEIQVPEQEHHIEITLQPSRKPESSSKKRTAGISYAERSLRISCHKLHTIALLSNARVRNQWLNDPLLHARLLSLTPMHLQNAFAMIHKSRVSDQNQRGRMFEAAIRNLTEWWTSSFFDVLPQGHIRNRTYDDIQARLASKGLLPSSPTPIDKSTPPDETSILIAFLTSDFTLIGIECLQDLLDDEGETIRSPKSLMKHALMRCGSRDTSAQLFTALCRSLGIPARLVVSLQSLPWQSSVGKPKPKYQRKVKGKVKQEEQEGIYDDKEDDDMEEVDIPTTRSTPTPSTKGKGKERAMSELEPFPGEGQRLNGGPVQHKSEKAKGKEKAKPLINLRKQRPKGNRLGSRATSTESSRVEEFPDPLYTPPVFWTEVFSRPDGRWIPVDPIRCIVNKRKSFDPTPSLALPGNSALVRPTVRQENRMMYVLAFEEDGYARDVTRRYAREYSAKVVKVQAGGGGRGRQLWWDGIVQTVTRPYRLQRDDVEDEELDVAQLMEGMPTTLTGFKDHPLYVLERHLRQNEVIHPPPPDTSEVGKFRGESVYPRSAVVALKTAETWLRTEGRTIKTGCQPLKMAKLRASTVGKMREVEVLREAGASDANAAATDVMQGLYARSQTERFVPDPVINGIIPKNNFGNIDLYVPSMLPEGAAHVPFKGVAKVARKLGFSHAEAVTGFEFKKRRAFPVKEGVVIAKENEQAYWESERAEAEKARAKREDQAIKRWIRLIQGLRIRQRLQDQYVNKPGDRQEQAEKPNSQEELIPEAEATTSGGGFIPEADNVVQAFSLPKYQHVTLSFEPITTNQEQKHVTANDGHHEDLNRAVPEYVTYDIQSLDVDPAEDDTSPDVPLSATAVPMTMQQLAEAAAKKQNTEHGSNGIKPVESTPTTNGIPDNQKARPLRSQKVSRQSTPSRGTKTRKRAAPVTKNRGSAKSRTAMGRNHSSRKRRRPSEESDSHIDSDKSSLEGEFGSDHDDDDDRPKKRSRTFASASSKRAPSPPTRTLCPRKSKTSAQLEAE